MPQLPQLSFQPYIDPGTSGEPLKELGDLGQTLNQRYDANLAQSDALDEHISQLGTTINAVDQPILNSLNSDTRDALTNIKQNGDWENAQIPIRQIAKRLLSDPALTIAQQNKQAVDKINGIKEQAQVEGHHLIQYQDYENTPTLNPDGTYNKITGDGVFDKKLAWDVKQKSFFDGLEPNSSAYKDSSPQRDDETGAIYQIGKGSSTRYVNATRIAQVVKDNLDNYLQTDEGQQQLKVLQTTNSENKLPVDYNTAKEIIKHQMLEEGLTKTFSDKTQENSEKLAPGKQPKPGDGTTLTGDVAVQQNQNLGDAIDALTFKKNRNTGVGSVNIPTGDGTTSINVGPDKGRNGFGDIPDNFKDTYNSMFKMYSDNLGSKDPNVINPKIQSYLKSIQDGKITPMVHSFTDTKQIDAANNFVRNGNLDGVPFYDPQTNKQMSLAEIKANYKNDKGKPIDEEDIQKARVAGNYDTNNPFAELTGNDAFVAPQKLVLGGHNFVIGSQPQVTKSPDYIGKYLDNKISRASRVGQPTKFTNPTTNDNVHVYANGDGTYILQGKTQDGKDIPATPIPKEQLIKALYAAGYTKAQ